MLWPKKINWLHHLLRGAPTRIDTILFKKWYINKLFSPGEKSLISIILPNIYRIQSGVCGVFILALLISLIKGRLKQIRHVWIGLPKQTKSDKKVILRFMERKGFNWLFLSNKNNFPPHEWALRSLGNPQKKVLKMVLAFVHAPFYMIFDQ